ncbi:helix-turn-helix domain-containing protein [Streptosporangium sp. NPDC051022]|uniref:helix-turn-helix transcriptional regulator n=1 Tax=Streptosporangium sp. NPDC051022 TaxID=3155752 RepID=UPI00341DDD0B
MLTRRAVAVRLGVCVRTLERWEKQGSGPQALRLGPRLVRYPAAEVDAWLARAPKVQAAR